MSSKDSLTFNIDLEEVAAISSVLEATETQMLAAFNRALSRTQTTMMKHSRKLLSDELGAKSAKRLQRRIQSFRLRRAKKGQVGDLKLWTGLNDISVQWVKGRMIAKRNAGASFSSSKLGKHRYDRGFIFEREGKKYLYERDSKGIRAARIPIPDSISKKLSDEVLSMLPDVFMHHFEIDLKGRVKTGLMKVDWWTGREKAADKKARLERGG
ncbi:hypothetical protein [Marinomonas atlantica]|uniref:hypothetical protein n=1 Tax=Marinomonas atlantica TaxID=1806668 RepID=UPI00082997E1|nr:hypothetical protein [Marinomonas atlantica]